MHFNDLTIVSDELYKHINLKRYAHVVNNKYTIKTIQAVSFVFTALIIFLHTEWKPCLEIKQYMHQGRKSNTQFPSWAFVANNGEA